MQLKRVERICSKFKKKKVLIFGDIILDRYIFGQVDRISPEAPVPVVKIEKEEFRPGGAGNVAMNIDKLGASGILMGVMGNDIYAKEIYRLKNNDNEVIKSNLNKTIVKTRVISNKQQIIRIDREAKILVSSQLEEKILNKIRNIDIDGIIVSDYAKGTLTTRIMESLSHKALNENIPIIVDPKPANFNLYKNINGITPNLVEAEEMVNKKIVDNKDAELAARQIRQKYKSEFSLITRGDKGITVSEKGKKTFHQPVFIHEIYDVTGAGDTVVSVLMLSLLADAQLKEAVCMANAAASIVIERIGASQTSVKEIIERIKIQRKK